MGLKAAFTIGENSTTVTGLYQWDYGRVLEIESQDLGSEIVEIHFACPSMTEAIVRSCTFIDGVGEVTIPDACLEQANTITAWIYQIHGTEGHTSKTISLPVNARTRPSANRDILATVSDQYTELITEVNDTVAQMKSGEIVVAQATNSSTAGYSTSAGNAASANYASTAGTANKLASGWVASHTTSGSYYGAPKLTVGKVYLIAFIVAEKTYTVSFVCTGNNGYSSASSAGYYCYYNYSTSTFSIENNSGSVTASGFYIREI